MKAANDIREVMEKQGLEESVHYILKDHLGSWTAITDADGNVEQELSYDAWGSILASKSAATLSKETKASMRQVNDALDSEEVQTKAKIIVKFPVGLINGQAKKVVESTNQKKISSNQPPMILMPKEEQSFYQQIIYAP